MSFSAYVFLLAFLPISLIMYWRLQDHFKPVGLLFINLIFYAFAGPLPAVILSLLTVVTFVITRTLLSHFKATIRTLGLILSVVIGLLPLAYFKYFNKTSTGIETGNLGGVSTLWIPLGISYYTFNLLSYVFDVYCGRIKAEVSFLRFAVYASFFPTIVAGPLTRYSYFEKQINTPQRFEPSIVSLAITSLGIGLAKKLLIADVLAGIVTPLFENYQRLGLVGSWIAALAFAYQLYFDFSGYSDMAVGIGYLFGVRLPQNFNSPYSARSITEFWQRWHITLSAWYRDYFFTLLSRVLLNQSRKRCATIVRSVSLVLTMALVGFWHGSNSTFILWGVYNGILLAIHAQFRQPTTNTIRLIAGRVTTFLLVLMGWVLFRSPSLEVARHIYASMLGLHGAGLSDLDLIQTISRSALIVIMLTLLIVTNLSIDTHDITPRNHWLYTLALAVLIVLSLMSISQTTPFIYAQF